MDMIKKYIPHAFAADTKERMIGALIIYAVIFLAGVVISWLIGTLLGILLGWISVIGTVVGWILKIAGFIVNAYALLGVIFTLLVYFKVLK